MFLLKETIYMLTPSLHIFSYTSSLIWVSPTSHISFGYLKLPTSCITITKKNSRIYETSQVYIISLRTRHDLLTPIELSQYLAYRYCQYCLLLRGKYRLLLHISLTELDIFTLSHYGSNSLLPTLKPNLTTLAPRLNTSDLLGLTRFGLSPN